MESERIDQLLVKYLDAETTIQEESILSEYFTGPEIAPHLEEYRALFIYFAQSKTEYSTKTIQLETEKKNWNWISAVASIVLLISIYSGNMYNQNKQAEFAFQHTQEAFQLLSKNLNRGTNAVMYLENYEATTSKVFKESN